MVPEQDFDEGEATLETNEVVFQEESGHEVGDEQVQSPHTQTQFVGGDLLYLRRTQTPQAFGVLTVLDGQPQQRPKQFVIALFVGSFALNCVESQSSLNDVGDLGNLQSVQELLDFLDPRPLCVGSDGASAVSLVQVDGHDGVVVEKVVHEIGKSEFVDLAAGGGHGSSLEIELLELLENVDDRNLGCGHSFVLGYFGVVLELLVVLGVVVPTEGVWVVARTVSFGASSEVCVSIGGTVTHFPLGRAFLLARSAL